MKTLICSLLTIFCVAALAGQAAAQFPDMIYYKFDEGAGTTTANLANPGVGSPVAPVVGPTLNGAGQFGTGLLGTGTGHVDTGWLAAPGTASWTISFWLDATANPLFCYVAGNGSTSPSWRWFCQGAAGVDGITMRGPVANCDIPGGAGGVSPAAVAWSYDATVPEVRCYLNGVNVNTVPQAALNILGTGNFYVGQYATSTAMVAGIVMDEFRMYSYALNAGEVAATWAQTLYDQNVLAVSQSGPGVGDLNMALTQISPTAFEGWTLLSNDTAATKGTGPFLGIYPDATTWAFLAIPYFVGNPIHFHTIDVGFYPTVPLYAGPGQLSSLNGLTFDFVTLLITGIGQYDSKSNVERVTFQ